MSYSSAGRKPFEKASKSSHHHIINDETVQIALSKFYVPKALPEASISDLTILHKPQEHFLEHVVAIDGGYTETLLKTGYPNASLHFFQFGALYFKTEDLKYIQQLKHIAPEDMQKLRNIARVKFPLGTKGVKREDCTSITESIRKSLFEFLQSERLGEDDSLLDTLAWFVFHRYKHNRSAEEKIWNLASHPCNSDVRNILLEENRMKDYIFSSKDGNIYLSDIFRLHEIIDDDLGASGISGYVAGLVEHLILLHIIRNLLKKNKTTLDETIFILDRPTGWFGVTAGMHRLMLDLNNWLFSNCNLFLVGLEKSGAFVEHASEIQDKMKNGSILILNDQYIYSHISPGNEDPNRPYASTSYYGHKIIFKTKSGQMHVASLPVKSLKKAPKEEDFPNLHKILSVIELLHCDMYENALLPVALTNKLVSLSAHPSSQILTNFARSSVVK